MDRILVAKQLLRLAKEVMAIDFTNKESMDAYLDDHPNADPENHRVVESDRPQRKQENEKGEVITYDKLPKNHKDQIDRNVKKQVDDVNESRRQRGQGYLSEQEEKSMHNGISQTYINRWFSGKK